MGQGGETEEVRGREGDREKRKNGGIGRRQESE